MLLTNYLPTSLWNQNQGMKKRWAPDPQNGKKYIKNINSVEVHPHNWVLTDIQWMMTTGSPPNLFHPTLFIQPFGWWPNRVAPKKSWLVPFSFCYLSSPKVWSSQVRQVQSGPVRPDRSSQKGPKSGNIWNLGT